MKKLVLIVGLVLVAASCQKEQIVPRTTGSAGNNAIMACPTNDNQDIPAPGTLSSTGTAAGDNGGNLDDDGDITDPMRKKDKKGN